MKRTTVLAVFIVLAFAAVAVTGTVSNAQTETAKSGRVFTSITTDDVNRAAMAVKFTHAVMKTKGMEATLFFNVYAVNLVRRDRPSPVYPSGQSLAQMIQAFMADGGRVMACPMCMKNIGGMTNSDLMKGVAAKEGGGVDAVTMPNTMVLSY